MPATTMSLQEQHAQYMAAQNERPRRHEGERDPGRVKERSRPKQTLEQVFAQCREDALKKEEQRKREGKENRGSMEHRRNLSVRERKVERDEHYAGTRRHSHMQGTELHQMERKISYQPGAVPQVCGHYKPTDMDWTMYAVIDQMVHRDDPNSPYGPSGFAESSDLMEHQFEHRSVSAAGQRRHMDAPSAAGQAAEMLYPKVTVPPATHQRHVAIDSDVVYVSEPTYTDILPAPAVHPGPTGHSRSHGLGPQHTEQGKSKPLPAPPHPHGAHDPTPLDPNLTPPYWMETIGHAFWTLAMTLGHLLSTVASAILIFVLGLIHCTITSINLVIAVVCDGLSTMIRIFFNLVLCHFHSGDWGWDWTNLTKAWQKGRKSQWVWELVGRVSPGSKGREERVAKRVSLHEARKEEYKREQEEKALEQGQGQTATTNKRYVNAALYGHRPMVVDVEKGTGWGPNERPGNQSTYY